MVASCGWYGAANWVREQIQLFHGILQQVKVLTHGLRIHSVHPAVRITVTAPQTKPSCLEPSLADPLVAQNPL